MAENDHGAARSSVTYEYRIIVSFSMEDKPPDIQEIADQKGQFCHEFSMIYMEVQ
jgi:hypothetical protein